MNAYNAHLNKSGIAEAMLGNTISTPSRRGQRRMTVSLTGPEGAPSQPNISRQIPVADVPVYPVLSGHSMAPGWPHPYPNVLDVGSSSFLRLGRYAIALAFKHFDLQPGDKVLVPAYHCDSMIYPVLNIGAKPIFYKVRENLRVDIQDIESRVDSRTRAVIATHYFGFHQDVAQLRDLCDRHKLVLIEDCAHAFYGRIEGAPIGSFGDYAIASMWKFFPIPEGACLVSSHHALSGLDTSTPHPGSNLRALTTILDQARYYGRLWPLAPAQTAIDILSAIRARSRTESARDPAGTESETTTDLNGRSSRFDPNLTDCLMLSSCRRLFSYLSLQAQDHVNRRRQNYAHLLGQLQKVKGCRPILPELFDGVVPYMLPLWIEKLPKIFPLLEDAAMPMQRFGQFLWPDTDKASCPVSEGYSRNVIQIPCHQELTESDLNWMVETLRRACVSRA
jgi:dTDP-4-amino-4,6-dideoxygalactose transaminase